MAATLDTDNMEQEMQVEKEKESKRRLSLSARVEAREEKSARTSSSKKDEEEKKGDKGEGKGDTADKKAKEAKKKAVEQKKKDSDFRVGQKKLMTVLIKQVLRSAQANRDFASILLEVLIIKGEEKPVQSAKLQTIAYNKLIKEKEKTSEELGPPHLLCFAGFLKGLISEGEAVGKHNLKELTVFLAEYEARSVAERNQWVRFFKVDKMYKAEYKRVSFSIQHRVSEALVSAAVQAGGVRKVGRAPATFLERELQEFLEALEM